MLVYMADAFLEKSVCIKTFFFVYKMKFESRPRSIQIFYLYKQPMG